MEELQKQIKKLQQQVEELQTKRIYQWDIPPQVIKNRHQGEPNSYVYSGLAADRPTSGAEVTLGVSIYFATDTNVLSIWNGTSWVSETLT